MSYWTKVASLLETELSPPEYMEGLAVETKLAWGNKKKKKKKLHTDSALPSVNMSGSPANKIYDATDIAQMKGYD